jgi:hypothetical protein
VVKLINLKSTKSIRTTNELSKAYVCQNDVCFSIPSVLVENMKSNKVILGNHFLYLLYPISSIDETGITTVKMGTEVKFAFASRLDIELDQLNLVTKLNQTLEFLKIGAQVQENCPATL